MVVVVRGAARGAGAAAAVGTAGAGLAAVATMAAASSEEFLTPAKSHPTHAGGSYVVRANPSL